MEDSGLARGGGAAGAAGAAGAGGGYGAAQGPAAAAAVALQSWVATAVEAAVAAAANGTESVPAASESEDPHGDEPAAHGAAGSEIVIFQLFAALILGAGGRHLLKHTGAPYTVVLLLLGLVLGLLARTSGVVSDYTSISGIDPHLMLFTFLPVLLFESSYSMEYHVFIKSLKAILLLAVPGVLVATALTATLVYGALPYGWSFTTCLLLGAILSATDPVAVVALLRELGASKTLATLIEGESLVNDGTAIVVFSVMTDLVMRERRGESTEITPGAVLLDFLWVALGGPAVGMVFGKLAVTWLSFVFNDALVEITVTLGFTYLTFYVAEGFLGVSGVLAVVVFGIYMNAVGRTRISTEVEHFLHRFYEMLSYLANTLIFILCGLVAAETTDFALRDFGFLAVIYVGIHVVRGLVVLLLAPLLTRTGYGLNFSEGVVLTYGGLRGGVSLALAMLIRIEFGDTLDGEDDDTGSLILFHVAGIVCLTLLVNGTTIRALLKVLGMSELSSAKVVMMKNTSDHLKRETGNKLAALKRDPFLGDADWHLVRSYAYEPDDGSAIARARAQAQAKKNAAKARRQQDSAKKNKGKEGGAGAAAADTKADDGGSRIGSTTGTGAHAAEVSTRNSSASRRGTASGIRGGKLGTQTRRVSLLLPSALARAGGNNQVDYKLLRKDAVQRFLRAVKQNYWRQFEGGQLGQNAVLALNHITEVAMDEPRLNCYADLSPYMDIPAREQDRYDKYKDTAVLGKFLGKQMFGRVLFAFHFGLGFVHAHEYVLNLLRPGGAGGGAGGDEHGGFRVVASSRVSAELSAQVLEVIDPVKRAIYMLREAHPEIAVAIKTVFASKRLLNYQKEVVRRVQKAGAMEEDEAQRYVDGIEGAMKRLHFSPPPIKLPDKAMYLKEAPCMRGVSDAAIASIMEHAEEKMYKLGDNVIRTGDISDGMYLILRGVVRIEAGGRVLAVEGPGTIFGELSLLSGGKRKASVVAETYCSALYVSTSIMKVLMTRYPHVRQRLWEYASMKIAETVLAAEEAFAHWRRDALQLWIQTGQFVSYDEEQCAANPRVDVQYVAVLLKGGVEVYGQTPGPGAGQRGDSVDSPRSGADSPGRAERRRVTAESRLQVGGANGPRSPGGRMLYDRNVIYGPCTLRMADAPKLIFFQDPQQASGVMCADDDGDDSEQDDDDGDDDGLRGDGDGGYEGEDGDVGDDISRAGADGQRAGVLRTVINGVDGSEAGGDAAGARRMHKRMDTARMLTAAAAEGKELSKDEQAAAGGRSRLSLEMAQLPVKRTLTSSSADSDEHGSDGTAAGEGIAIPIPRRMSTARGPNTLTVATGDRGLSADLDFTPSPRSLRSPSLGGEPDAEHMDKPILPSDADAPGPSSPGGPLPPVRPPHGRKPSTTARGRTGQLARGASKRLRPSSPPTRSCGGDAGRDERTQHPHSPDAEDGVQE